MKFRARGFSRSVDCKDHMLPHAGEKLYKFGVCDDIFFYSNSLRNLTHSEKQAPSLHPMSHVAKPELRLDFESTFEILFIS